MAASDYVTFNHICTKGKCETTLRKKRRRRLKYRRDKMREAERARNSAVCMGIDSYKTPRSSVGGVFEVVFHVLRNAENAYGVRFLHDRMHERSAALPARLMIPAVSSHIRSEGARLREWFLRTEGNSPSKHITPMLNMFIVSFIA